MKFSSRHSLFKVCPKTGRIVGVRAPRQLPLILLPAAGFLALVWFLIRVVPKPSRAAYPCQRVAAPLAGSFLLWLTGIAGASLAFHQVRTRLRQARYAAAGLALVVAAAGIAWAALGQGLPAQAVPVAYTPHPANAPIGAAKGLMPGRVAWVHDPQVTDWDGVSTAAGQRWYDRIDQAEATDMMQWALTGYTDTATAGAAWDAIFRHFNGGAAYQPGEKVFIKVNLTTANSPNCDLNASYNWNPSTCGASWTSVGNSPQLMLALLDQLVHAADVAQSDITIGDSTGLWVNELYDILYAAFPGVNYMDARGTQGRTPSTRSTVPLYWSAPASEIALKSQDYLLQAVVDAKYMINFAILKSHELAGITVTAKNHFGSFSGGNANPRKPTTSSYYDLHLRLPMQGAANASLKAQYRPLVDLNGHTGMGGKTVLYLVDGIYGGKGWAGTPSRWAMAPFNNNWPASLFLSMDEVAIDSVAFDFLSQQWPEHALGNEGVQDYLHEMALANNPPSGTVYDPEHDGVAMVSQGVHEHWNNVTQKQYTRNIGTGDGIDLLYVTGDPTENAAVQKTYMPLVIDGTVDTVWAGATIQALNNVVLGAGAISGPDDLSASFRALYDDTNLYLLVGVTDDNLVHDSLLWDDDDSVALMIDGDYSRGASYDGANDFELGFRWNDLTIARGANSAPVPAGADFEIVETDGGYRLEVKLPLAELGITPGYGRLFGLDVHVGDDDGGSGDAKIAWWATDDSSPQYPYLFGAGRLEGPQAMQVRATTQGTGVLLKWTHFAWNDAYEVHRSASPYFTPAEGTRLQTVAAPGNQYPDSPAAGGPWFYIVRARQDELGATSNRTGKFQFDLTVP